MGLRTKLHALTVLTRKSQDNPYFAKYIKQSLSKNIDSLAVPAVEIAKQSGGLLGQVLAECLDELPSNDLSLDIYEVLAETSVSLVDVYVVVAKSMHEQANEYFADNWKFIADTAIVYAEALLNHGDQKEALIYAQKAACLFQRHAPDLHLDSLQSLSFFAGVLAKTGKIENALLVQHEVISRYQTLKYDTSKDYIKGYTRSLMELCAYYNRLGQLGKAITFGRQALESLQQIKLLGKDDAYLQLSVMRVLADCYEKADELTLASELLQDCIKFARNLYGWAEDSFVLMLISTLETQATLKARQGHQAVAHSLGNEAIGYMKKIYQNRPQIFAYEYANTLISVASIHMMFDHVVEASELYDEAISLLDPLHLQSPDSFGNLATALSNRVGIYLEKNELDSAIKDCYRLICLYRSKPEYIADLAFTLKRLADCRIYNGEMFKAERSILRSVTYYYDLVERDEYFLSDLCYALSSLAVIQKNMGDFPLALETVDEVMQYLEHDDGRVKHSNLKLYYSLAITRLQCFIELEYFDPGLNWANTLIGSLKDSIFKKRKLLAELFLMRSDVYIGLNKEKLALSDALESAKRYRDIAKNNLVSSRIDWVHALTNVCYLQSSTHPEKALGTIKKVICLYREMPLPFTDEMLAEKIKSLLYQADVALTCRQETLALNSIKEALIDQEQLVNQIDRSPDHSILRFNLVNLEETKALLTAIKYLPESKILLTQLTGLEAQFQLILNKYNAKRCRE